MSFLKQHNTRYVAIIVYSNEQPLKTAKAMKRNSKQEVIIQASKETLEKCILCGKEAHYSWQSPVLERQFYLMGAGQLCAACYRFLYDKAR